MSKTPEEMAEESILECNLDGLLIKLDLTMQTSETLAVIATQLKTLFYKAHGPNANKFAKQYERVCKEIDFRKQELRDVKKWRI
jgi:hypothetical protein